MIELLVTITILAFCLTGIALTYINFFLLSDLSRDTTLAANAVQAKMENLTMENPASSGNFLLTAYGFPDAASQGWIEVQPNYGVNLTRVRIAACFQSRGKLIGDSISACRSSPVEVVTLIIQ